METAWIELTENKEDYLDVMKYISENFRFGKYTDDIDEKLGENNAEIVKELFDEYKMTGELNKEFQESFTKFFSTKEYDRMIFTDEKNSEIFDMISDSFEISWKIGEYNTYYIDLPEYRVESEDEEIDNYIRTRGEMYTFEEDMVCGDTSVKIDQLKICSDLDEVTSGFNFYYLVIEYTVTNNTENKVSWGFNKTGNIYGDFHYKGLERYLAGNDFIKDEDITSERRYKGILNVNGTYTGSMALIIDRTVEDPEKGLELQKNDPMTIILNYWEGNNKYDLELNINS